MAFEDSNLIAPIWQRTATNVLSSSIIEESKPTEETFDDSNNLDTILQQSESVHDIKQNEILSKTCQFSFLIFNIF